jgi:hypothetical protein
MTETLGDRIRARRQAMQDMIDEAQDAAQAWAQNFTNAATVAVQTWAQNYTDAAKVVIKTYVDNQIASALSTAKTYVDNQIATTTTYVNQQNSALSTQIAKVITDNNLQP